MPTYSLLATIIRELMDAIGLSLLLSLSIIMRGVISLKAFINSSHPLMVQTRHLLFCLQGIALTCWVFDIVTTYFSLKIPEAIELNPLGWPLGILGAVIYYVPAMVGSYYLLQKGRSESSFYGAIAVAALTLFMASMNLNAGIGNFNNIRIFGNLSSNIEMLSIWFAIGALLAILNVVPIFVRCVKSNNVGCLGGKAVAF